jgi:hypothetical protein
MYYINNIGLESNIVKVENDINYFIPMDESNTDYKQYLEWVAEGNEAEEWTAQ